MPRPARADATPGSLTLTLTLTLTLALTLTLTLTLTLPNPHPNPNPNPDPNPNPNPNPEQVRKGSIDLPAKKLPSSVGVSLPVIGSVRVNLVSTHTGPQALARPSPNPNLNNPTPNHPNCNPTPKLTTTLTPKPTITNLSHGRAGTLHREG